MKNVRWGIIGCGNVTEVKSGPGFQKAEGSELVAVMRRDSDLASDYARRHRVPHWYDDAGALIADPSVDAVYVATPPSSHMEYVLAVARARKPVYVEKPMARSTEECRRMIEGCDAARVPLFVAYYRRALPRFLAVRSWINEGRIGTVRSVSVRYVRPPSPEDLQRKEQWRTDMETAGCGYFCDMGSHIIDLLFFLLGPIRSVHGIAENRAGLYDVEDRVTADLLFESGVDGRGEWDFAARESVDRTEIIGSRGSIVYATFGNSPVTLTSEGTGVQHDLPNPVHIQQPMIQTIVDEVRGIGKCESTGRTGAETTAIMDRILGRT